MLSLCYQLACSAHTARRAAVMDAASIPASQPQASRFCVGNGMRGGEREAQQWVPSTVRDAAPLHARLQFVAPCSAAPCATRESGRPSAGAAAAKPIQPLPLLIPLPFPAAAKFIKPPPPMNTPA
eukprot:365014-Chlamydomonas_euryale.AAC.2